MSSAGLSVGQAGRERTYLGKIGSEARAARHGKSGTAAAWNNGAESRPSTTTAPSVRRSSTLRPKTGWLVSACFAHGTTTTGQCSPSASAKAPSANVSAIPAAHLFTLLNVIGAASTAIGGGVLASPGRRNVARVGCPV